MRHEGQLSPGFQPQPALSRQPAAPRSYRIPVSPLGSAARLL